MKFSGQYCGNAKCSTSMGLCGRITFGYGQLSDGGYWEHPCVICAAVAHNFSPRLGDVWPDPEKNKIPDWAGQATPGHQLTCIRGSIEHTMENFSEGITSSKETVDTITRLMEQLKKMELHLKKKPW